MRLKDKRVLVTGSTTGIGEAIARRCVAEGAKVLIHGLERDLAEKVAGELGEAASMHIDDLADPQAPERIVAAMVRAFGGIDVLVNNAAWIPRSNLKTTDVAIFDRAIAVNVRAPFLLVRAALDHLKQSQGCVLNIGSVNAYCGEANLLPYSISKGALMTLTRNLADALGRDKVRVNQINPGWVLSENEYKTKVKDGLPADWPEHLPPAYAPSGRILSTQQLATACVYWLGDESRPVSGSVVEIEQFPIIGRNPVKESMGDF